MDVEACRSLKPYFTEDIYRANIRRACLRAGVPVFGPHQLRHAFITRVANNPELGSAAASAAANHERRSTTDGYIKTDKVLAYRVAAAMQRKLG